jgi:hypothetical protein
MYHIMKDFDFVEGGLGDSVPRRSCWMGCWMWPLLLIRVVSLIPLRLSILMMDVEDFLNGFF